MPGIFDLISGRSDSNDPLAKLYGAERYSQDALTSALLGGASGMLKASGPSTIPTSIWQALGGGFEGAQAGMDKNRQRVGQDLQLTSAIEGTRLQREVQKNWMELMKRVAGGGAAGAAPGAGAGAAADVPRPQSLDEVQKLPPGTLFMAPDGTMRTR